MVINKLRSIRQSLSGKTALLLGASLLLSLLGCLLIGLSFFTDTPLKSMPILFADQLQITHNNEGARATKISYARYQSVADQRWKAHARTQNIELALPAYTDKANKKTGTRQDGKKQKKSSKNPVVAAPHIYVDLNNDTVFAQDECIYNKISYMPDGSVKSYGVFLKPGFYIKKIKLEHGLEPGDWNARLTWTGIIEKTHELATPMSFDFKIHVR